MNHKKRAMFVLGIAIAVAVLPAFLLVVCVDPFRIYHKPFIADVGLQENQRYQNAGLINSWLADETQGYDAVMIGTSMSQNFTSMMANQILGWKKSMRLFMPGAVAEEQLTVLQHALHTGRVKHVLLELHPFLYQDSYRQRKQVLEDASLYFPDFLYNHTVFDDAPYIFNIDVIEMSWRALRHKPTTQNFTPETIGYWAEDKSVVSDHAAFNLEANIKQLKQQTAGFTVKTKTEDEIRALEYPILDDTLMPLLNSYCNTGVEIVMFVPPWPRFRYQKSEKVTLRAVYMMRYILANIAHCSNISLYNFDLLDFTGDLNNYKDEQHYLPAINREILSRIAQKQNRLARDNVAEFENHFISNLNDYSVYTSYTERVPEK